MEEFLPILKKLRDRHAKLMKKYSEIYGAWFHKMNNPYISPQNWLSYKHFVFKMVMFVFAKLKLSRTWKYLGVNQLQNLK